MDTSWVVAITAIGTSVATGVTSIGAIAYRAHLHAKEQKRQALHDAILEALTRSMALTFRTGALSVQVEYRSGPREAIELLLRMRKPSDPFDIFSWLNEDLAPLYTAWTEIGARADQKTVRLMNDLMETCRTLIEQATHIDLPSTAQERAKLLTRGRRWSPEQRNAYDQAVHAVAVARKNLNEHARKVLRFDGIDLWANTLTDVVPA